MKITKIASAITAVLLLLFLVGCSNGEEPNTSSENENPTTTVFVQEDFEEETETIVQKETTEKKATEASKTEQNKSYESGTYIVSVGSGYTLNVRSSPSTNSETIDKITDGEIIEIERVSGGWGYTSYYTSCGWVNMKYLEKADYNNIEDINSNDYKDEGYSEHTGNTGSSSDEYALVVGEMYNDEDLCSAFPDMFAGSFYGYPVHFYPSLVTASVSKEAIVYKDINTKQEIGRVSKGTEIGLLGVHCDHHNIYAITFKNKSTGKLSYGFTDGGNLNLD